MDNDSSSKLRCNGAVSFVSQVVVGEVKKRGIKKILKTSWLKH
jgi:hypothetical protein